MNWRTHQEETNKFDMIQEYLYFIWFSGWAASPMPSLLIWWSRGSESSSSTGWGPQARCPCWSGAYLKHRSSLSWENLNQWHLKRNNRIKPDSLKMLKWNKPCVTFSFSFLVESLQVLIDRWACSDDQCRECRQPPPASLQPPGCPH